MMGSTGGTRCRGTDVHVTCQLPPEQGSSSEHAPCELRCAVAWRRHTMYVGAEKYAVRACMQRVSFVCPDVHAAWPPRRRYTHSVLQGSRSPRTWA